MSIVRREPDSALARARHDLMSVFEEALGAVNGRTCVRRALQHRRLPQSVYVAAVGKAAAAMCHGAFDVLNGRIAHALIVTKVGHVEPREFEGLPVNCLEAGHPLPDRNSLVAGRALLEFLDRAPADAGLLFLVSGGTSSLVEVLPDGVSLSDWHRANEWLLASGYSIAAINRVRKGVSCIKGGRLARHLAGRRTLALLISDVPGDDATVIGSGLLTADVKTGTDEKMERPVWLDCLMGAAPAVPAPDDPVFRSVELEIVARLDDAEQAAEAAAARRGYCVVRHQEFISGEACRVGERLSEVILRECAGVHIWGGETTVHLPERPGRGGRNQSLALAAALKLSGHDGVLLLSVGTDGTDGPTDDAGALVDGGTVVRGRERGYDPERCLAQADAGRFLEASGDLIQTGPTGTNVMDLMLGLKLDASSIR